MIGLILVTHGRLAEELRQSLEHVAGRQPSLATVCIGPNDTVEAGRAAVLRAICDADHGSGVIVVTDMFGATPCNLALSMAGRPDVDVVAGANLPMLVELARARHTAPRAECVARATAAGRRCIIAASRMLARMDVDEAEEQHGRVH